MHCTARRNAIPSTHSHLNPTPSKVDLPGGEAPTTLTLVAHLPADYPSTSAPVVEARLPPGARHRHAAADAAAAAAAAAVLDAFTPGAVVLHEVAETLRERELALGAATAAEEMAREERLASLQPDAVGGSGAGDDEAAERGGGGGGGGAPPPLPPPDADAAFPALAASLGIVSHPPVVVKRSTFQAHVARIASPAAARAVVDALLTNRRVAAATHNIMAYRIVQNAGSGDSTVLADCDDDGEALAGGRLAHMLAAARVDGGVVIVVSRWFGGVLLGPARFGIINNTARDALVAQGFIKGAAAGSGGGGGSRKR
jgi:hypothetical protein